MNSPTSPYLLALNDITWHVPTDFRFPSPTIESWLTEKESLSKRLRNNCNQFEVELQYNQWLNGEKLTFDEASLLMKPERCLNRQVTLLGDKRPWVLGYTLIPQDTVEAQTCNLSELGEAPLGETVFQAEYVERDQLQVGCIETEEGILYARRSRLWMNHKPMLVTELFLPFAPIYHSGDR